MSKRKSRNISTSWSNVSKWYTKLVGQKGSYFHQHLIIPGVLRLLQISDESSILDLGCGQGILERNIPKQTYYQGIDSAQSLVKTAKTLTHSPSHHFSIGDITKPLPIAKKDFTHSAIILTLQNIEFPDLVIKNCTKHLRQNGRLVIVLNHPCFRIPKQSSWQIDESNKLQYRRINRYLTPLKIPITTLYNKRRPSSLTWSFHYPLSYYSEILYQNGFVIEKIEEWASDKTSFGEYRKMENRARTEFPLFLTILAKKLNVSSAI